MKDAGIFSALTRKERHALFMYLMEADLLTVKASRIIRQFAEDTHSNSAIATGWLKCGELRDMRMDNMAVEALLFPNET